jgi:hypothetical protein
LVSLDFSLTAWSLVIFSIQALSLIAIMTVLIKPNIRVVLSIILLWILSQFLYILYGYETKQLGFLLLGIFNFISSILILFLRIGSQEEEEQEEEGEEYDD